MNLPPPPPPPPPPAHVPAGMPPPLSPRKREAGRGGAAGAVPPVPSDLTMFPKWQRAALSRGMREVPIPGAVTKADSTTKFLWEKSFEEDPATIIQDIVAWRQELIDTFNPAHASTPEMLLARVCNATEPIFFSIWETAPWARW